MNRKIIFIFGLSLLFTACGLSSDNSSSEDCGEPAIKFAYPVGVVPEDVSAAANQTMLPSRTSWEQDISLIRGVEKTLHVSWQGGVLQALHADEQGTDTIWVTFRAVKPNNVDPVDPHDLIIIKIDISSRKIAGYYTEAEGGMPLPTNLFVTSNGELWGTGFYVDKSLPVLFRYDEQSDQFVGVLDQMNTLVSKYGNVEAVVDKSRDVIWLARYEPPDNGFHVYRFDILSLAMEEDINLSAFNSFNFTSSSNGDVWVGISNEESGQQIVKYNPESGDIKTYSPPPEFSETPFGLLYYDRLGRVWMGDLGWLDLSYSSPVWYQALPSSFFIDINPNPEVRYRAFRPDSIYESSNGLFWFTGPQGLVRLDPEEGRWCPITSDRSKVIEDSQGNLWIVAYGVLYKYKQ